MTSIGVTSLRRRTGFCLAATAVSLGVLAGAPPSADASAATAATTGPAQAATAATTGPAQAATAGPVQAGLTITPAVTTVGSTVVVVGTATNTTSTPVQVSLGVDNYDYAGLHFSAVSGSSGCRPRNLRRLIYCGVQSLAPGATASITLTLEPTITGSFDFRSYARITYTTGDTFAYGTLVAS